jgi:uncharacterized protein
MISPLLRSLARAITRLVAERPALIAVAALMVLAGLTTGMTKLELKTGYRGMFHVNDPLLADIEAMHRRYRSGDRLVIMLHAPGGDLLTRAGFAAIRRATEGLSALPETRRVTSLSTQRRLARTAIGPILVDLLPKSSPRTADGLEKLRRAVLEMPGAPGHLVTTTGSGALIHAEISPPPRDQTALAALMGKVRGLKLAIETSNPDLTVALGGLVVLNSAFVEAAERDMRSLFPAMAGLLCLGLWIFTRSWRGVLGPLVVVVAAILAALGSAGWLGLPITPILSIAPTIILGIGIADSLHVLVANDRARMAGRSAGPAFHGALRRNLAPIFLTTLTTGIGFLGLLFSKSPPFRDLGLVTAIGVAAALFFTITLLPIVAVCTRGEIRHRYDRIESWIGRMVDWTQTRRGFAFAVIVMMAVVALTGLAKTRSDDQLSGWFDHSVGFRQDLEAIRQVFGPTDRVSWTIPLPRDLDDIDVNFLDDLDAFALWLVAQPEAARVISPSTVLSGLTGPGPRKTKLALLKRWARSKNGKSPIEGLLADDHREARVIVTLASGSTWALRDLEAKAKEWLKTRASPLRRAQAAGPAWSLALLVSSSARAMLAGTAIAFVVIAACLGLILKSWRLGFAGLTAMILPPALIYGIWSWLGRPVGLAESVVAATSLGLLVDTSIHILSRYQSGRTRRMAPRVRIRRAFEAAGPALCVGFMILIAGFAVLILSPFQGNMHFGLLTASTLAVGLPVALLVLPFGLADDPRSSGPPRDQSISTISGSPPA